MVGALQAASGEVGEGGPEAMASASEEPGKEAEGFAGKGEIEGGTSLCEGVCKASQEPCSSSGSQ